MVRTQCIVVDLLGGRVFGGSDSEREAREVSGCRGLVHAVEVDEAHELPRSDVAA